MTNFDLAKKNYDRGLWSKEMLATLVKKGKLTTEQYKEITGVDYTE
jgi:uncharacterized XkdX family phage protein